MSLLIIMIAGLFIGLTNLCMKKSLDKGGHAHTYLLIQLFISCIVNIFTGPIYAHSYSLDLPTLYTGIIGGIILGSLMKVISMAMAKGPASLSVAFVNASTALPAIIMYSLWGSKWNFTYTYCNAIGTLLVIGGLFWATGINFKKGIKTKPYWIACSLSAFALHALLLCLTQWRAISLNPESPLHPILMRAHTLEASSHWFLPIMFFVAWGIQIIDTLLSTYKKPTAVEAGFGILGGIFNGISICLVIIAGLIATPLQATMMFPLYSVSIIMVCNLWGRYLYQDHIAWKAQALCIIGLLIGTL